MICLCENPILLLLCFLVRGESKGLFFRNVKTQFCFVFDFRLTNRVSINVCSQFAVLGTMVVMDSWLLVIFITLDTNRLFVIQSVLPSLFILVWSLRYRWLYLFFSMENWLYILLETILFDVVNFVAWITVSPLLVSWRSSFGLIKGLWHSSWCNVWILIPW